MQLLFEVDNVKCGGCARAIDRALRRAFPQVTAVTVDPATGRVAIETSDDIRAAAAQALKAAGYPERTRPAA